MQCINKTKKTTLKIYMQIEKELDFCTLFNIELQ